MILKFESQCKQRPDRQKNLINNIKYLLRPK